MARSAAPSSSAPASDVTMPASNAATTSRPSTDSNPNKSGIHSVGIGALRDSARNGCATTLFADSPPRCTQFGEKSALGSVVKQELSPYSRDVEQRMQIDGPTVMLKPDVAQAIAVALHELATNAAKYGALSEAAGQVRVEWSP